MKLLKKFPPQVSSRNAAAGWACLVHNEVNARLEKDIFDCSQIGDFYDCGCSADENNAKDDGNNDGDTPGEVDEETKGPLHSDAITPVEINDEP